MAKRKLAWYSLSGLLVMAWQLFAGAVPALADREFSQCGGTIGIEGQPRGRAYLVTYDEGSNRYVVARDLGPDAKCRQLAGYSSGLTQRSSLYLSSARANVVPLSDGRTVVLPGPAYTSALYLRDALYTLIGLGDGALIAELHRWFEAAQNKVTGEVPGAVALVPWEPLSAPADDETNLLFIAWAGIVKRQGGTPDNAALEAAYRYVQGHVRDGRYVSPGGPFRYWADTVIVDADETIAYNQGLYVVALRFLRELGVGDVSDETIAKAVAAYRAIYRADLGYMPLGANNTSIDGSALFPEFLHRYFFSQPIVGDHQVLATVDYYLAKAAVHDDDGTLVGVKIIARPNGDFLRPDKFSVLSLASPGDYQNGGYWPLFTQVNLALAYSINGDDRHRKAMEELAMTELANGLAKEYLQTNPGRMGFAHELRQPHAWNVLVVTAWRWAGLVP